MEDPALVGPWRVLGRLGAGGMGVVYRARHADTGALAAVKTIRAGDPAVVRTLRREVRALARLRHPGVVRILEDGEANGAPWYAMDLVEGPTLSELQLGDRPDVATATSWKRYDAPTLAPGDAGGEATASGEALPRAPADTARLARVYARLAAALAWVHGEGVVHQDLKPSNVIVRDGDLPVLVDFGLAGAFAESHEALDLGAFGGTVAYLSPEHLRGEPVDARADLYALGVMLFHALTGRPPFVGPAAEVIEGHLTRPPPPPASLAPGTPSGLATLVLELLAKDRRERIGHAGAIADRLAEWAGPDAIPADWPAPRPYLYRPSLVGRDEARRWVDPQLDGARVALIGAAGGLGKTRLLVEIGRRAAQRGHAVLTGRAVGAGALHPLRAPLEQLAERHRADPERVFADRGPVLASFAPGVSGAADLTELPPAEARRRVVHAVADTLRTAARHEPVVLLLDDLHDADELTVGVLEHLASEEPAVPLAVVATWRTDRPAGASQRLLDHPDVAHTRLGPLDEDAVAALAGDMLGDRRVAERLLAFLSARAEGNPLFVAEYLRAALDRGMLARDGAGRWTLGEAAHPDDLGLPASILGLLTERIDALEPRLRALAELAAVLGRDVDARALARAAGLDEEVVFDALRELSDRHVLAMAPTGAHFAHPALRDALYDGLDPERRLQLHRAAWAALPEEPDTLAARAGHAAQAGERDAAADLWFEAGQHASRRWDHASAEAALRACMRLASPSLASQARYTLGHRVLRPIGRLHEAVDLAAQDLADARARGDEAAESRALRALGAYAMERRLWEEAHRHFSESMELDRARGRLRGVALSMCNLGLVLREMGRVRDAIAILREAMQLARTSGGPREHEPLAALAACHAALGEIAEAESLYGLAIASTVASGHRMDHAQLRGNLANLYAEIGNLEEARAQYAEALAILRQTAYGVVEALTLTNQGVVLVALGDLEGGAAAGRRAAELYLGFRHAWGLAQALVLLADALHDLGREQEAADVVARIVPTRDGQRAEALVARARVARLRGDDQAATAHLIEARGILDTLGAAADEVPWLLEAAHAGQADLARVRKALRDVPTTYRRYYAVRARELGIVTD